MECRTLPEVSEVVFVGRVRADLVFAKVTVNDGSDLFQLKVVHIFGNVRDFEEVQPLLEGSPVF